MRASRFSVLCLLPLLCCLAHATGRPAPTWEGPVGLFTQPTAEILPLHHVAITYSEVRFSQERNAMRLRDTWFTGGLVATPARNLEVAVTLRREAAGFYTNAHAVAADPYYDASQVIGHVKYVLLPSAGGHPGVALGVSDIANTTGMLQGLMTGRGRRIYLVGSAAWAHVAVTYDRRKVGLVGGARLQVAENADLIVEYATRPVFIHLNPPPNNPANFNIGVRFYPPQIPGARVDLSAVADGQSEFAFSLGKEL